MWKILNITFWWWNPSNQLLEKNILLGPNFTKFIFSCVLWFHRNWKKWKVVKLLLTSSRLSMKWQLPNWSETRTAATTLGFNNIFTQNCGRAISSLGHIHLMGAQDLWPGIWLWAGLGGGDTRSTGQQVQHTVGYL